MDKYTKEEVSQHCTENSLWIIIDNYVYDITSFYKSHPGGLAILLKNGGQNVTEKFDKIKGHTTNPKISDLLANMCIGTL